MAEPPSPATAAGRLLLVDGHAYAYRAFYAIRHLSSPDGKPTNAIYGFVKMFSRMCEKVRPTHVGVLWDGGLAAERMAILPEYKQQREPMPADLETQLDEMVAYLGAARVTSICRDGVEADDLIATLARRAARENFSVVIASADKDFMQLVSPHVGLLNPNDKSENIWSAAEVRVKSGVEPEQVVDWLSLIGDGVDNIPGVEGVGPKTAAALLARFGTVKQLYARLADVKSEKMRAKLAASEVLVQRNREMIRLRDDLPTLPPLSEFAMRSADDAALLSFYSRWGFRTLRVELEAKLHRQPELL
jgi:DNA polymerase-1